VEKLGGADKLTVTPLTTSSQAAGDADVPSQSSAEISSSKNAKSGNTTVSVWPYLCFNLV